MRNQQPATPPVTRSGCPMDSLLMPLVLTFLCSFLCSLTLFHWRLSLLFHATTADSASATSNSASHFEPRFPNPLSALPFALLRLEPRRQSPRIQSRWPTGRTALVTGGDWLGSQVETLIQSMVKADCGSWNIYHPKKSNLNFAECRGTWLIRTQEPQRITQAALGQRFERALYVIRHPVQELVHDFLLHHQVAIWNQAMFDTPAFQQFIQSRAHMWASHVLYWYQNFAHKLQIMKLEEFFYDGRDNQTGSWLPRNHSLIRIFDRDFDLVDGSSLALERMWELEQRGRTLVDTLLIQHQIQIFDWIQPVWCMLDYDPPSGRSCHEVASMLPNRPPYTVMPEKHRSIHIITTFYQSRFLERQLELNETLWANLNNPEVSRVHVWVTDRAILPALLHPKIVVVPSADRQPLYFDLFQYANEKLPNEIVVIQNADIFWASGSIAKLKALSYGMAFALSRHSNLPGYPETVCPVKFHHNQKYVMLNLHDQIVAD